jgi:DNA-binding NtrC family response regulator
MTMSERLLLVDDDVSNRVTLAALLEDEGYLVEEAEGCGEAMERIGDGAYGVVILDWNLGRRSAAELLGPVRERHPQARVLILTGAAEELDLATVDADAIACKGDSFDVLLGHIRGGR